MIRLRMEGNSAGEVQALADIIEFLLSAAVHFSPVREGKNPKYVGQQKFFAYTTLLLSDGQVARGSSDAIKGAGAARSPKITPSM